MRIGVIPDTQVTPESNVEHLRWAGEYFASKQPGYIVHLGDHWDMPSLCSYDVGTKEYEGRQYIADIEAGIHAMEVFLQPIRRVQHAQKKFKKAQWKPRMIFLEGNHEYRIQRAISHDRKLDGLMGRQDFELARMGWEFHEFKEVVIIEGVCFAHYFVSGIMGRAVCSARSLLTKKHMSCVMGHVQDKDIAYAKRADGSIITGLFAGIFYQGDQPYLDPQTNGSWSGIWMLNDVDNGSFDEMPISMKFLKKRFG